MRRRSRPSETGGDGKRCGNEDFSSAHFFRLTQKTICLYSVHRQVV